LTWVEVSQGASAPLSVLVSGLAAYFVFKQLRSATVALQSQDESSDTACVLEIWARLDAHWVRFRQADPENAQFEFGQLISYYEMACKLFKDKVFKTRAAVILFNHLQDILPEMRRNANFGHYFDDLKSQPDTFESIDWLCIQPRRR
jgi:hypothetical protein